MNITSKPVGAEIPTSSMADIAFLLIIYFMLTAAFATTRGLDFHFPDEPDQHRAIDPVASVHVQVLPGGGLLVDRRPMELQRLLAYLEPKLAINPAKPVIVAPEPGTPYGRMVAVLDELRQGKDLLGLRQDIAIALPTERERTTFWR